MLPEVRGVQLAKLVQLEIPDPPDQQVLLGLDQQEQPVRKVHQDLLVSMVLPDHKVI